MLSFELNKDFVNTYSDKPEKFGFNGLGAITFYRTYSRPKENGEYESWSDVCERVINGMYSILKDHAKKKKIDWNEDKSQNSAKEAFDRMFNFKWTPSGRGLWMMGTPFIHERKTSEALLNCAFISTENIKSEKGEIFEWVANMLMLGVGVAFDTLGANSLQIHQPNINAKDEYFVLDSREGWAKSIAMLVDSYFNNNQNTLTFDYELVRAKGQPINGFGGVASGPEPLKLCHDRIRTYLDKNVGKNITSRTITDICNAIGGCVVAGNVRRSAELALGEANDADYASLKNYSLPENEYRQDIGWASNNSVIGDDIQDYSGIAKNIFYNGEPGVVWKENIQKYGRMGELKYDNAVGVNPCSEIPLAHMEMCNLVEVYMMNAENEYDFQRTLKFAYLYTKAITLTYEWITHPKSRKIMVKNRRVGVGTTGVAQFLSNHSVKELIQWWDNGYQLIQSYDNRYSSWLQVNKSIRTTTIKPSGTVSLLAGATPGIHYPHDTYYIRRIRIQNDTPMLEALRYAGYEIELDVYSQNTSVVSVPIAIPNIEILKDKSIWEQMKIAELAQRYWSDNSVSVTISFSPNKNKIEDIDNAISLYADSLKCVSMLPITEEGQYQQMPYESITKEQYLSMQKNITQIPNIGKYMSEIIKMKDQYCENDSCLVK